MTKHSVIAALALQLDNLGPLEIIRLVALLDEATLDYLAKSIENELEKRALEP